MENRVRAHNRLKSKEIATLPAGTHEDGSGLRLVVEASGSRRWVQRVTIAGNRHNKGLGPFPVVSLAAAREESLDIRRAARKGQDLIAERKRSIAKSTTFKEASEALYAQRKLTLTSAKYSAQWPAEMGKHVYPHIGDRPIAAITHADIIEVMQPIWHKTPVTARRMLQRMDAVFTSAILRGQRESASPCAGVAQELGTQRREVRHRRALPYDEVAAFIRMLHSCPSGPITKLAFEWLILTATRSAETRGATISEVRDALWVIPRERIKARQEHVVPLSSRCLEILSQALELGHQSDLLFPNRAGRSLSDMAFTQILRNNGFADRAMAHGFRSSFRDWATEVDKCREVVAEAALAHAVRDKTEAAYRRTSYLEERVALMQRWAEFCAQGA